MRHRCFALVLLVLVSVSVPTQAERRELGNLIIDGVPEIPKAVAERMEQYQNVRSASFLDWNLSGPGMLISTRFGETSQIHFVEQPGGARRQITFFKEPVADARYYPGMDRRGFLFSMDTGGAEFFQLYFFDLDTGRTTLLTDGQSRNTGPRWSPDGKWIAFSSNLRNGRDTDIRLMRFDQPGVSEVLVEAKGSYDVLDWSPDQSRLLVRRGVSANESYLYWCDLATKKLTQINPQKTAIAYGSARWSRDGQGVYYTSDEASEFQQLTYYDLTTKKKTVLTDNLPWDVQGFELSPDGRRLAFVINAGGISQLHVINPKTRRPLTLPDVPLGVIGGLEFSKDGNELGFTLNSPQSPGDAYSIKLSTRKLVRWTFSETGGLNPDHFVAPQLIHYPTFDRVNGQPRLIPAFYYRPRHITGRAPVVISIHGGPEAQERPSFNSTYQYLVNELGIAVLAPNVRGSSGYGKTYLTLDNGMLRENAVKDIGALLDWIAQQPELDAERVGVMGGSYGGYMVLASMTHYNDRIRAGIDVVGISNFVTFLESTQEYRRDLRRAEYGDERDPKMREFLLRISPLTNAHKITKPLFVVQGLNDPRVPYTESEQIVKTVRQNGGQVWYLAAKDEGHGFRKKANRDFYLNAASLFWEEFLLGNKPVTVNR